ARAGAGRLKPALLPLHALQLPPGPPELDDEPVASVVETDVHRLVDPDPEQVRIGRGRVGAARAEEGEAAVGVGDLLRLTGDLRVALPLGRVGRAAVEGEARIAAQVDRLARVRHRAEPEIALGEERLDSADPRRAVEAQRGDRLVDAGSERAPA